MQIHRNIEQGTDEWLELRRGILTASEVKNIITLSTKKPAANEKARALVYEMAAQTVSGFVELSYISDDMIRGTIDEVQAAIVYQENYDEIENVGFITNDKWSFTLGYSPDGLVGTKGSIEIKSRRQKFQLETIVSDEVPAEFMAQIQTGLLVSEREWCDFISYCAGMPMFVKRVYADPEYQKQILEAADYFYTQVRDFIYEYNIKSKKFIKTERLIQEDAEIIV